MRVGLIVRRRYPFVMKAASGAGDCSVNGLAFPQMQDHVRMRWQELGAVSGGVRFPAARHGCSLIGGPSSNPLISSGRLRSPFTFHDPAYTSLLDDRLACGSFGMCRTRGSVCSDRVVVRACSRGLTSTS